MELLRLFIGYLLTGFMLAGMCGIAALIWTRWRR